MRKYLGSTIFVVSALAASPLVASTPGRDTERAAPTVAVQHPRVSAFGSLRDEAAMVLVGTALIGLASVVRRAA